MSCQALKEFTSNSAEFSDGARLAAADAVDALGTAVPSAALRRVASAAAAGIGGRSRAAGGAIAAAAFGTKGIDAAAVKSWSSTGTRRSRATCSRSAQELGKVFCRDAQFEQTLATARSVLAQKMLNLTCAAMACRGATSVPPRGGRVPAFSERGFATSFHGGRHPSR